MNDLPSCLFTMHCSLENASPIHKKQREFMDPLWKEDQESEHADKSIVTSHCNNWDRLQDTKSVEEQKY